MDSLANELRFSHQFKLPSLNLPFIGPPYLSVPGFGMNNLEGILKRDLLFPREFSAWNPCCPRPSGIVVVLTNAT